LLKISLASLPFLSMLTLLRHAYTTGLKSSNHAKMSAIVFREKKRFIGLTSAHSFKISGNAFQLFSKMKKSVEIMIEKRKLIEGRVRWGCGSQRVSGMEEMGEVLVWKREELRIVRREGRENRDRGRVRIR